MAQLSITKIADSIKAAREELAKTDFSSGSVAELDRLLANTKTPLLIMVMGEFSTGKSTFINALVGKAVTVVDDLPTTAVITLLRYGVQESVIVHWRDGEAAEYSSEDFGRLTAEADDESNALHGKIDYVERAMPLDVLKEITIIDSPGLNALKDAHTEATRRFVKEADTVLWLVSAEKAASGTEYRNIEKLTPRLKPIVLVNKMDLIDEEEDDPEAFLEDIRNKLKDRAQTVIGLSAALAFEGKTTEDEALLESSNFSAFEDAIADIILPKRDEYKANSLVDSLSGWLCNLMGEVKNAEAENKKQEEKDYQAYVKRKHLFSEVEDAAAMIAAPLKDYCQESVNNASALLFLGVLYDYGLVLAEDDEKAVAYYEKASVKGNTLAQVFLGGRYLAQNEPDKAAYWLEEAAQDDNMQAKALLARLYYKGEGVGQDYTKALELWEVAGDLKDAEDFYGLGDIYRHGYAVEANKLRALECFQLAVDGGNTAAQCALADMLLTGDGVEKDATRAVALLRKSAEMGNMISQRTLGLCFLRGEGVIRDKWQGVAWLEKAAAQGDVESLNQLGSHYYGNDNVKARTYFVQSAQQNNAYGKYRLALMFLTGVGGQSNVERAVEFLETAAKQGLIIAQGKLASLYDNGQYVEQDDDEAVYWARQAAEGKDEDGMYVLGTHLITGEGTVPSSSEGLRLLKELGNKGRLDAQEALGNYYRFGRYFPSDQDQALYWLKKAEAQGSAVAGYMLARMYIQGDGVVQNYTESARYLERAAENGFVAAKRELASLWMDGQGVSQDKGRAVQLYAEAAQAGDLESQYQMGYICEYGDGVQRDLEKAKQWYEMAAQRGHAVAQNNLSLLVKDLSTAIYWQEQAVGQTNDPVIRTNLALSYFKRGYKQGNQEDFARVRGLCIKLESEGNGCDKTKEMLGDIFYEGFGVPKDGETAKYWYSQMGTWSDETSFRLGELLIQSSDYAEQYHGKAYLEHAASSGHIKALFTLGVYLRSSGQQEERNQGMRYLKLAAQKGYTEAQYLMGKIYEGYANESFGGKSSNYTDLAKDMYQKAASKGHRMAKQKIHEFKVLGKIDN